MYILPKKAVSSHFMPMYSSPKPSVELLHMLLVS